jgi:hypothetical protein
MEEKEKILGEINLTPTGEVEPVIGTRQAEVDALLAELRKTKQEKASEVEVNTPPPSPEPQEQVDFSDAVRFLKHLYQNCEPVLHKGGIFINLAFPLPDVPYHETDCKMHWVNFDSLDEDVLRRLGEYNGSRHCFYKTALGESKGGHKGLLKEDIKVIPEIWADDVKPESLEKFPLEPSIVVQTSTPDKVQPHWIFKEPLTHVDEFKRLENLAERLAQELPGDSRSTEYGHNARLPGTINPKKIYPVGTCAELKSINDKTYSLDDFEFLPELKDSKPEPRDFERFTGKHVVDIPILQVAVKLGMNPRYDRCRCGDHSNPTAIKFYTKPEQNTWCCFACKIKGEKPAGGDVITLVQKIKGCDVDQAVEWLEIEFNIKDESKPSLKLLKPSDIAAYKDPEQLIEGFPLYAGLLNILSGDGATYKSTLALEIARAFLTGQGLFGKYKVLRTGPVLLIDEETPYPLLKDRCRKFGLLDDSLPFRILHYSGIQMDDEDMVKELLKIVDGLKPILTIWDSLTMLHSQNENSSNEMRPVISAFRSVTNMGPLGILIHHFSKSKENKSTRGSGTIVHEVDYVFNSLVGKDGQVIFQVEKNRHTPFDSIIVKVEYTDWDVKVRYQDTQENVAWDEIDRVLNCSDSPMTVKEIQDELWKAKVEITQKLLRTLLSQKVSLGLVEKGKGEKPATGRTPDVYWILGEYIEKKD